MSKWTPGPWDTDEAEHTDPYQDIRIRSGNRGICRIWLDDAPVYDFNDEQRTNARLIAAAPEMAELLERINIADRDAITAGGAIAHLRVLAEEARALLAKVEGK